MMLHDAFSMFVISLPLFQIPLTVCCVAVLVCVCCLS